MREGVGEIEEGVRRETIRDLVSGGMAAFGGKVGKLEKGRSCGLWEMRRLGRKRGRWELGKKNELGREIRMIRGRRVGKGWESGWWKGR